MKNEVYYHISGSEGNLSIFTRDTMSKFPFMSRIYLGTGSRNNVQSWKTEAGVKRFVAKKFPEWILETSEEYKARKLAYKE